MKCVRISGIPKWWSVPDLLAALEAFDPSITDVQQSISIYPACCVDTHTALLCLNSPTGIYERVKLNEAMHIVNTSSGPEIVLVINSHFYNLTPLNTPEGPILADVVAVTGLAGHAFGSWQNKNTHKMWLKDFLPKDVRGFRIMTYGYNSNLVGDVADDGIVDYRKQFIQTLLNARWGAEGRPIIFIGHSMGGILILQALLQCKNGGQYKHLFDATHAIMFFGTPHQGMEVEELRTMVKDDSPGTYSNLEILQQLSEGSNFLDTQRENITNLWDSSSKIEILSFYETRKTKAVGKLPTGGWGRCGPEVDMVKKSSAQLFWPSEHRIPVPYDHTDMVKFGHNEHNTYQTVVRHMNEWKDSIFESRGRWQ
ncbi:hypothetical protein K440DRAFT_591862, partial [Wilcoxina mikolae CBS 423.85]